MSKFEDCHLVTHRWERGYSNHPRDPGGPTQDGVTQRVYDAWRAARGDPPQSVRQSTPVERQAIFRAQYWAPTRCEDLPAGIDLAVYDFAVNSGVSRAIRHLQAALGVKADAHIGELTLRAATEATERGDAARVVARIMEGRERFLRGLSTFDAFGNGWTSRLRDVGKEARQRAATDYTARLKRKAIQPAGARGVAYAPDAAGPTPPQDVARSTASTLNTAVATIGGAGAAAATAASQTKDLFGDYLPGWAMAALLLAVMAGAALLALHYSRKAGEAER